MPRTITDPEPLICPFTIVVDSNESAPFRFTGIQADSSDGSRPWIVHTITRPLWSMSQVEVETRSGRFIKGLADYTIENLEEEIQIERKSVADLYATLGQRRDEFEAEIARLDLCRFAAIVVEGDWQKVLMDPPRNTQLRPKVVSRTVLSWSMRYPGVHWFFGMHRQHAELMCFQLLMKYWEQTEALRKACHVNGTGKCGCSTLWACPFHDHLAEEDAESLKGPF